MIKKSSTLTIDSIHLNWSFDGIYKTILTGDNFQEITNTADHESLIFKYWISNTKNFLVFNADEGVLNGDVRFITMNGSNSSHVVYFLNTYSTLTFSVNLNKSGEWYAWGRMFFDSTSLLNSFYFQIDNNTKLTFGNYSQFGVWHWGEVGLNKLDVGYLTQGEHTITIYGKEPFETVMLDQILLTTDDNLVALDNLLQITNANKANNVLQSFNLFQNYPNPFNPSTKIKYRINQTCNVRLDIYNLLGEKVTELKNELQSSGTYNLNWNATNYSSGTYLLVLYAIPTDGEKTSKEVRKMMLQK